MRTIKFFVCISFFYTAAVFADMTLVYEKPDGFIPLTIKVSGDTVIYENNGDYGKTTSIINLKNGQTATVIHQQKMVMAQNKKSAQARAKKIEEMKAKSKKQLDTMLSFIPKEERLAVDMVLYVAKAGMKAYLETQDIDTVSVVLTDVEKTVKGKTCKILETRFDAKLATASCMVPVADVGVSQDDMARAQAASFYMVYLASQVVGAHNKDLVANLKVAEVEGVAIEMDQKLYDLGLWTLKEANSDPVPASDFEFPSDYKLMEM